MHAYNNSIYHSRSGIERGNTPIVPSANNDFFAFLAASRISIGLVSSINTIQKHVEVTSDTCSCILCYAWALKAIYVK